MTEEKPDPSARLRKILAASQEEGAPAPEVMPSAFRNRLPPAPSAPTSQPRAAEASPRRKLALAPAFWTIASLTSMTLNIVLLIALIVLLQHTDTLGSALKLTNNLLSGLYTNFEKMYQAHIRTTIPVATRVPVQLEVCIRRETSVTLTRDVAIAGARVSVQSGGLSIANAYTNIRLPAGVDLPIALDLCVPVEAEIPVNLNVQTDIPIRETELGAPIQGLMDTIRPIYCLLQPRARDLQGEPVCTGR
jgi:hypothetical protein